MVSSVLLSVGPLMGLIVVIVGVVRYWKVFEVFVCLMLVVISTLVGSIWSVGVMFMMVVLLIMVLLMVSWLLISTWVFVVKSIFVSVKGVLLVLVFLFGLMVCMVSGFLKMKVFFMIICFLFGFSMWRSIRLVLWLGVRMCMMMPLCILIFGIFCVPS